MPHLYSEYGNNGDGIWSAILLYKQFNEDLHKRATIYGFWK